MSRAGYTEDCDGWDLIRWRGAVESAIKGRRGQQLLRELLAALDAMPVKRLIAGELEKDGEVCGLGCLGRVKSIDMSGIDPEDYDRVAETFGIAPAMAREIEYINDERGMNMTPEKRWEIVRRWVAEHIRL